MKPLSNVAVRDIETVIHPYTNLATHRETGPLVVERGEGIHVWDSDGNQYIEGLSGLWCTALGYGNKELIEVATKQLEKLSYTHLFGGKSHDPAIELSEKLKELAPCEASKVLFTCSGSEANDTQVKLIWYYNNARGKTEKKKIISRIKGYHGVTVASGSLTGLPPVHMDFDLPIANITHTSCPHYYRFAQDGETEDEFSTRMADELEQKIIEEGPETVAAFIAEPVMGAGGVIVPPEGYFPKIQAVLDKYDIYMIADEVICGFGRTGNMWGSETFGIKPNSISVAKAITSAYIPLGGVTVPEDMYQAMLDESRKIGTFGHGYTYTGHPVGAAVANKVLEIYERDDIVGHVQSLVPIFESRLAKLGEHPLVGEARGRGMIGAFEMVADKATKRAFDPKALVGPKVNAICQNHGVILRNLTDAIGICPPLVMTADQLNDMFDKIELAIDEAEAWITKEDLRAA